MLSGSLACSYATCLLQHVHHAKQLVINNRELKLSAESHELSHTSLGIDLPPCSLSGLVRLATEAC